MKGSGIGGQAVMEGVMMKNGDRYAVAVRKPDNEIVTEVKDYNSISSKCGFFKLPIVRGVVAFIDSLVLGVGTLTYSASFFEEDEEDAKEKELSAEETAAAQKKKEKTDSLIMAGTVCLSIVLAVGIFMLLPYFLSRTLGKIIESELLLALIEGVIRIALFVGYVAAISLMKDIQRVFMYHGAEHKSINCIEHGLELTVENVRGQSRRHKRCGTSFLLIVMLISIIFFMFIRVDNAFLRILLRLVLIPVIAGVSYEFIKLAGRSDNAFVNILSKPGMALQNLTTREPDDTMIEVAIKSVEAVFNWREFLEHYDDPDFKADQIAIPELPHTEEKSEEVPKEDTSEQPVNAPEKKSKNKVKNKINKSEPEKTVKAEPEEVTSAESEEIEPEKSEPEKIENEKTEAEVLETSESEDVGSGENADADSGKGTDAYFSRASVNTDKKPDEKNKSAQEPVRTEIRHRNSNIDLSRPQIVDDEEDDEILKALDQYFIRKQDKDKT